jgi:pimeloyl-ACP methyl ester carboxylesterase
MQWRGHGESDVPSDIDSVRLGVIVDDLSRALTMFGIDDAMLFGHSMGVPIALEAWRAATQQRFAARIHGLALICGVYEDPIRTWHGAFADQVFQGTHGHGAADCLIRFEPIAHLARDSRHFAPRGHLRFLGFDPLISNPRHGRIAAKITHNILNPPDSEGEHE